MQKLSQQCNKDIKAADVNNMLPYFLYRLPKYITHFLVRPERIGVNVLQWCQHNSFISLDTGQATDSKTWVLDYVLPCIFINFTPLISKVWYQELFTVIFNRHSLELFIIGTLWYVLEVNNILITLLLPVFNDVLLILRFFKAAHVLLLLLS